MLGPVHEGRLACILGEAHWLNLRIAVLPTNHATRRHVAVAVRLERIGQIEALHIIAAERFASSHRIKTLVGHVVWQAGAQMSADVAVELVGSLALHKVHREPWIAVEIHLLGCRLRHLLRAARIVRTIETEATLLLTHQSRSDALEVLVRLTKILRLCALHHLAAKLRLRVVVHTLAHVQILLIVPTHGGNAQIHLALRLLLWYVIHAILRHLRKVLKLLRLIVELAILRLLHGRLLQIHVLLELVHLHLLLIDLELSLRHVLVGARLLILLLIHIEPLKGFSSRDKMAY